MWNKTYQNAIFGVLLSVLTLTGCSTHSALTYSINPDNVVALRKIQNNVAVGDFTSTPPGLRQVKCRLVGPVEPPEGMTFSEYIRKAFIGELQIAEKYDPASQTVLSGNLDHLEMSSTSGTWIINMTMTSSNGKKISHNTVYNFKTNFVGEIACQKAAQAFQPAVQNAIKTMIQDQEFGLLVR